MRPLSLLLLVLALCVPSQAAHAQDADLPEGTVIESVDVSGLSIDSLSPGLRRDIDALAGERLNRQRLDELAARIEEEHPDMVAAVRHAPRPNGQVRVIFLVARISDDGDLVENINTRYTVESVEIKGVPESEISRSLRDRVQALVGRRLDHDETVELNRLLQAERPGYDVDRRISRGTERGRIRVVFEFNETERLRWIPFTSSRSKFVYHADQGASGVLDVPMGNRNHRVTAGFAFGNDDDLIEEYTGVRLRLESRRLGTERLGATLEFSRLRSNWRDITLAAIDADPTIPAAYRRRLTIEPTVTVAINPYLRVSGGASISELEPMAPATDSQMASALVAAINYRQRWDERTHVSQQAEAGYQLRSATTALESDLLYTRHLVNGRYRYEHARSTVIAEAFFGGITGTAPLFERFTLGDTSTLRGWNKYDIAPVGGDRVFHSSLEYRYRNAGIFLDSGSVWTTGTDQRIRFSTGFGMQGDNAFVTLAFPLDTDNVSATFMMGVRF
jgi:outer membrane protein assembly factor BamA